MAFALLEVDERCSLQPRSTDRCSRKQKASKAVTSDNEARSHGERLPGGSYSITSIRKSPLSVRDPGIMLRWYGYQYYCQVVWHVRVVVRGAYKDIPYRHLVAIPRALDDTDPLCAHSSGAAISSKPCYSVHVRVPSFSLRCAPSRSRTLSKVEDKKKLKSSRSL